MVQDTRFDAAQNFVEELRTAEGVLDRAKDVLAVNELLEKFDRLGDLRTILLPVKQVVMTLRSLHTERAGPTLACVAERRDLVGKISEAFKKLGNLGRLRDQISILEDAQTVLFQKGDLSELVRKLWVEDLSTKLDALADLKQCLTEWMVVNASKS
jgi:hypothetical protein